MQRNMAANCGMDYRAAGELVASIAIRELQSIRAFHRIARKESVRNRSNGDTFKEAGMTPGREERMIYRIGTSLMVHESDQMCKAAMSASGARDTLTAVLRLRQALPMLEGLLARASCKGGNRDPDLDSCSRTGSAVESCAQHLLMQAECQFDVGGLAAMTDASFWQTLQQLVNEVRMYAGEQGHVMK